MVLHRGRCWLCHRVWCGTPLMEKDAKACPYCGSPFIRRLGA